MVDKNEVIATLVEACARRATIEFKTEVEGFEYVEAGMKAKLLSFEVDEEGTSAADEVWSLWLDFEPYDAHNRKFEAANFYDSESRPVLTAREAGWYEPRTRFYVNRESLGTAFRILDEEPGNGSLASLAEALDYLETVWADMEKRVGYGGTERCFRDAMASVLKHRAALGPAKQLAEKVRKDFPSDFRLASDEDTQGPTIVSLAERALAGDK